MKLNFDISVPVLFLGHISGTQPMFIVNVYFNNLTINIFRVTGFGEFFNVFFAPEILQASFEIVDL